MTRVYNFAPGPAMLPEEVLSQVRDELLDWHGIGMSIMEVSHRGSHFKAVVDDTEQDLRDLLNIPLDYSVLFLQGGAQTQFSAIPMNLLGKYNKAAYIDTGVWSQKSIEEANRYCDAHIIASAKESHYTNIPEQTQWGLIPNDAAYLYYVDNETINGIEFPHIPEVTGLPLICDMSSNMLSRPFDVSRYGLIFACAQKNIGPAGLTVVIIQNDLLKREALVQTPSPLRYDLQASSHSLLNTPPTFAWYIAGLVFKWLKKQGGMPAMADMNQRKADKLYQYIDSSDFYHNPIDPHCRSRMNVIFTLANETLEADFVRQSTAAGLTNLQGHRLLGGMRASIYNAMPEAGIDALIAFMQHFEKQHG